MPGMIGRRRAASRTPWHHVKADDPGVLFAGCGENTRSEKGPRAPHHRFRRDLGDAAAPDPAQCEYVRPRHPSGDTTHRFYQMWQQSDCSIANATEGNPVGCLNDLYPFVITTYGGPGDKGGGTSTAFYNMADGDAPLLKKLADEYTISDNYHQPGQGGTGIQHVFLGIGDGPRIPLVAVSPYSKGGHVVHTCADHASILKFIERNWHLPPLSIRSRAIWAIRSPTGTTPMSR
jgi:hypothetical protein